MNNAGIKYDNYKNKICPYCQSRLKKGADITVCSACGVPHHRECWDENSGCTSYGCRNNPLTERNHDPYTEDVGNLTVESIRQSLVIPEEQEMIPCPSCKELIEGESVYCKFCGHNLKQPDTSLKKSDASEDFKKEFRKRYSDKISFIRKRQLLTFSSFILLITAFGILVFIAVSRLNDYFASDKYRVQLLLENYEQAIENRNIDSIKVYLADDYEFINKAGKKSGKEERIKRFEGIFKSAKDIEYDIRDFKFLSDSTVTGSDKKISFIEDFIYNKSDKSDKSDKSGKSTDSENKIMRISKSDSAADHSWKIYRESAE
ncbi:MAG: DUF4440 domain-containing protein [Ignavibacteria bacterium]|nr:DUF4440 domain-containing protein [Ignavibacteria bacterium]